MQRTSRSYRSRSQRRGRRLTGTAMTPYTRRAFTRSSLATALGAGTRLNQAAELAQVAHLYGSHLAKISKGLSGSTRKKANRLYSSLTAKKHFQEGYTIQKYTEYKGKSQNHLTSKNNIQIKGFIDYILKIEPDKKVYYHEGYWERVLAFNEDTKYPTQKFEIKF